MYDFNKIQFGDKDFYVVDEFEFEGTKYLYIYEDVYEKGMKPEDFEGDVEVNFIFEREDGKYENGTHRYGYYYDCRCCCYCIYFPLSDTHI